MTDRSMAIDSTVRRALGILLLGVLSVFLIAWTSTRLSAAMAQTETQPQNTTAHFEGALIPATEGGSVGDVIAFDVTYDANGNPTNVDYTLTISSLVLSEAEGPLCASGGQAAYTGNTKTLLPWPGGQKMYTFVGDERPGGVYPSQVSVTGLLGRSLTGKYIGPNHSQGTVQAFYEISEGDVSFTIRCIWTWKISNGPGGVLSFSQPEYNAGENEGSATITAVRQEVLVGTVTVDYTASNGSAEEGKDFAATSGTLSFGPSETQKQFTVPILPDEEVEGIETLSLTLSNASTGAVLDAPNPATLKIDDTPNLAVLPFALNTSQLAQEGTKFIFKNVVVRVFNNSDDNGETVPQATLQVKNGDTVVHTASVGPLPPGGSPLEVTFDWEVTDLLIAGAGSAQLALIATVDPGGTIPDRDRNNNRAQAGLAVSVLPVVAQIDPQYELQGKFFLRGVPVSNKISVTVNDWNGDAQGQGSAPFGQLHFKLNQNETTVPGQIGKMDHTYDMGTDFANAGECFANTLSIWAEGAHPSFVTDPAPPFVTTAVNLPQWVDWVKANLQQYDLTFTASGAGKLVNYMYGFSFPEPPFSPNATVPGNVPILGGSVFGFLPPTVASIDTTTSSGGPGSVEAQGQTGFTSPVFTGSAELFGSGETHFRCKQGVPVLDFDSTTFGFVFDHKNASKDLKLNQVLPTLADALALIPFWGSELAAGVNTSKVGVAYNVGGGLAASFRDKGAGELEFDTARGSAEIGLSASSTLNVLDDLSLSITGGGKPYVTVKVPRPPIDYLEQIGLELAFEAIYQIWSFQGSIPIGVDCSLPGGCGLTGGRAHLLADSTGWQLLPSATGGPDYARFQTGDPPPRIGNGAVTESTLLSNIYAAPAPALAVDSDGKRLLAYIHDTPGAPQGRGTDVRALHWNGTAWESPVSVTSDQQPEYNPALAYDANGKGVLLWERSNLSTAVTPSLDITFTQSLEIATSVWNGSAWSAPAALTANSLMDRSPQLAKGSDGTLMALWQTGNGDTLTGTGANPVALTYALWNGSSWSSPVVAVAGLSDLRQVRLAVRSASEAALVVTKGDATRSGDTELYYSTFNGTAWSGLQAVTANSVDDTSPTLAYDSTGRRHLLWLEEGELRWLLDSFTIADAAVPVPAEVTGAIRGLGLTAGPGGVLALNWQSNLRGQPGIATALYDPAANRWSTPDILVGDGPIEAHLTPAYAPDGRLHIAYRKTAATAITRTLTLTTSEVITVPNVLTEGQRDLAYLVHTPGRDLSFDRLTVEPANPAPGQGITLTAVLRNAGGLSAASPRVRFLDGASPLATQDLANLAGGYTRTVTVQTVLGASNGPYTLRAVADPDSQLAESDESNNEIFLITSQPDLRPGLPDITSSSTIVSVTIAIENSGAQATSTGFAVTLRAGHPLTGTNLAENQLPALAAGQSAMTTLAVAATALLPGEPTALWILVDSAGQVAESDEGNNSRFTSFLPLPDLTVAGRDIAAGSGQLQITVHNRGQRSSAAASVWIGKGSTPPTGTSAFYTTTVNAIAPGGSQTLSVSAALGRDLFAVKIDGENSLAENDETNNLAFRRLQIQEFLHLPLLNR
ncbi:MAG: hypothetical protein KF753_21280 [Caldilineaceae bacterium]|nr:hypothetical protein [Caldilineaceae bacterium]